MGIEGMFDKFANFSFSCDDNQYFENSLECKNFSYFLLVVKMKNKKQKTLILS